MTLTIAIEGKGVIANCDALTNDTGGTGTGDWAEVGGGSISLTTDTFLFGSSCIAGAYSNKSGLQEFTIGETLDFDVAGNEEGQHIYMWIHCPTIGLLETKANKGLAIRICTDASNYREYLIAGSDDANGWAGGWKCFVIDPTKAGSVTDTGTYDYGAITQIGVWIETSTQAKGDNIFIDQIAVGFGIRVTGTSTTGWKDVVDYCTDYPNRAWGMFQEREGIYYQYGKIWIGDSTQSANVSFTDSGRIIQYGICEYWYSSAWTTLADIDNSGIIIEDHASYTTTFQDGILVGLDAGRSGSTIIGNSNHNVSLDFYGGNNTGSITKLYGTSFKNITGAINFGNDSDFHIYSVAFEGCSQVDPVGAPKIRNSLFISTSDSSGSLLWNENIDISVCQFISNTTGAGIEMPSAVGTPYAYDALLFSDNTYDVNNTSGSAISINKNNGSDPSSYTGSTVTFLGVSVDTTITVKDSSTPPVAISGATALVWVTDNVNYFYQASVSITGTGTTATVSHTAHGLTTGDSVIIEGVENDDAYNGAWVITTSGDNAYTYTTSQTITQGTASGSSITSTMCIIDDTTDVNGEVTDTRSWAVNQPIAGRIRKASSSPYYKEGTFIGTIDKDSGFSTTMQLQDDE